MRQDLQAAHENRDPLFAATHLPEALASLDALSAAVARSLPYAVCDTCDGGVGFENCPDCRRPRLPPRSRLPEKTRV